AAFERPGRAVMRRLSGTPDKSGNSRGGFALAPKGAGSLPVPELPGLDSNQDKGNQHRLVGENAARASRPKHNKDKDFRCANPGRPGRQRAPKWPVLGW